MPTVFPEGVGRSDLWTGGELSASSAERPPHGSAARPSATLDCRKEREGFSLSDCPPVYVGRMPQLGQIHSAQRDDTILFRLTGEFDLSNAWKIKDALLEAIRNEDHDIVVDLTAVRFMDAQLVRALVTAR